MEERKNESGSRSGCLGLHRSGINQLLPCQGEVARQGRRGLFLLLGFPVYLMKTPSPTTRRVPGYSPLAGGEFDSRTPSIPK